jgi:ABC-type branched-subunit amino acid transport system substrate-binding protein
MKKMIPGLCRALAGVLLLAGAARADYVVGQVTPLSGPQGVTGRSINAGARLYFDAVNAQGGVNGQRIKLVVRDDAQKPEETVRLIKDVIATQSPLAMIGTVGTSNLEAVAKDGVLARTRVPMVGAVSGAATVAGADGMLVVKARYRDEVERLFSELAHLQVRRVGLVYQDDGLGKDVLAGAEESAHRHGIELVVRSGYPRNTTDTSAALAAIQVAKPQAIFLGATTAAAIDFVKRYRAAGGSALLYGMSIIDPEVLLKSLGRHHARGYAFSTVLPLPSQSKLAVVREFAALRAAANDPDLSARSIEGFIAAKALVWALGKASRPTPESVATALRRAGGYDAGGFFLDFSAGGRSGSRYVDFAIIGADGRFAQ